MLDRIDRRLLHELQLDSQRSIAELAERVGISSSACHRRIRSLEEAGIISGYGARVAPDALGLGIHALIDITLTSQRFELMEEFERAVMLAPAILECVLISGHADYRLRVAARDMDDYDRLHREQLGRLPGVSAMQTSFLIRPIKQWRGFAIAE